MAAESKSFGIWRDGNEDMIMRYLPHAALVFGVLFVVVNVPSAQTPAQNALVDVGSHKLNVRVMGHGSGPVVIPMFCPKRC
jgi:hypothetical protein